MSHSYKERPAEKCINMFIYNTQANNNPFGFHDKNSKLDESARNRSRAVKQAASSSKSIKRISKKNIEFLQSLGLEVKVR